MYYIQRKVYMSKIQFDEFNTEQIHVSNEEAESYHPKTHSHNTSLPVTISPNNHSLFVAVFVSRLKNGQGSTGRAHLPCHTKSPTGCLTPACPQGRSPSVSVAFSLLGPRLCSDRLIRRYILPFVLLGVPVNS